MKKRILLICKETFSVPFFYLESKLIRDGYETALLYVYPEECLYNECKYTEITYYKIIHNCKSIVFSVKDIAEEFIREYRTPNIDWEYLKNVEAKYTNFKPLNLQLISSQPNSRYYHYREKFNFTTDEQNLFWIQLCYRKAESVLDGFKPEYIIDLDTAELFRTILNEVAYQKNIPYISIEHPRYARYKIPTFNLGLSTEDYFKNLYKQNLRLPKEELSLEYVYIMEYRKKTTIMPDEYKGSVTATYDHDSVIASVKTVLRAMKYMLNMDYKGGKRKIRKKANDCIILTKTGGLIKDFVSSEYIRQRLFRKNKYFSNPVKGEKYVYMPLHLIPESTTFVKAPYYINELHIIEQVSKSLPIGIKLYVKEHQSMLGERPLAFYKAVAKLPNVKMVQLNYYKDPKPWLDNSIGVISVTGTGAYEAALLGKKSVIFGDVPFDVIDGVTRVRSYAQLPVVLRELGETDNIHSCAAYIRTVKDIGTELNLNYLIDEGYRALAKNEPITAEYEKELDKLYGFYLKAFEMEK